MENVLMLLSFFYKYQLNKDLFPTWKQETGTLLTGYLFKILRKGSKVTRISRFLFKCN